jgi:hypothetical protein
MSDLGQKYVDNILLIVKISTEFNLVSKRICSLRKSYVLGETGSKPSQELGKYKKEYIGIAESRTQSNGKIPAVAKDVNSMRGKSRKEPIQLGKRKDNRRKSHETGKPHNKKEVLRWRMARPHKAVWNKRKPGPGDKGSEQKRPAGLKRPGQGGKRPAKQKNPTWGAQKPHKKPHTSQVTPAGQPGIKQGHKKQNKKTSKQKNKQQNKKKPNGQHDKEQSAGIAPGALKRPGHKQGNKKYHKNNKKQFKTLEEGDGDVFPSVERRADKFAGREEAGEGRRNKGKNKQAKSSRGLYEKEWWPEPRDQRRRWVSLLKICMFYLKNM